MAQEIKAYFNLDLAQLRGYGLGTEAEDLLIGRDVVKDERGTTEAGHGTAEVDRESVGRVLPVKRTRRSGE